MKIDGYELLNDAGFLYTQARIAAARLRADFGDGYEASARTGTTKGLRAWSITIDVLPDLVDHLIVEETSILTRARYLWEFWKRHKLENNSELFVLRCPYEQMFYLSRFADDELTFEMLTAKVFSTGLEIIQQRRQGVTIRDGLAELPLNPSNI